MGNNTTRINNIFKQPLHNRILNYNDINPVRLNKEELANLPEGCIITLYNRYDITEYNSQGDCNIKETLNITPFVLINCKYLAQLSVVKYHLHKYPDIACLDIRFTLDDQYITPDEQLKSTYFKCPDFPWNHLETYRKYPEWFEDKNKF